MFKNLWRILIMAVIAIAAFFVVSSLSLSNRLDEDYAPRNWRYRWILLDGSLALIYLMVFMAVSWLWRPVSLVPILFSSLCGPIPPIHKLIIRSNTPTPFCHPLFPSLSNSTTVSRDSTRLSRNPTKSGHR